MVLDFVDLVRRLGLLEQLDEVVGLGNGEIVEIVLELLLDSWSSAPGWSRRWRPSPCRRGPLVRGKKQP